MKVILQLTVTSLLLSSLMLELSGSAAQPLSKTVCYGYDFTIYRSDLGNPQNLYFTSDTPGSQRVQVLHNKKPLDPHYELTPYTFSVMEATDNDTGSFSAGEDPSSLSTVLNLEVLECHSGIIQEYGSNYDLSLPTHTHTHTLEFTPLGRPQESRVLWRRTGNPPSPPASEQGSGRMDNNRWRMDGLTQENSGYYTFRNQHHKFIMRNKITVKEQHQHINDSAVGQDFHIRFGMDPALFDLSFFSSAASGESPTPPGQAVALMRAGVLLRESTESPFAGRLYQTREGRRGPALRLTVNDLRLEDSGRYELRDQRGNLALLLELDVQQSSVRLVGGSGHCAGRLEMKHRAEWRPAGDPHRRWSIWSAAAVCKQLGCGSAVSTLRTTGPLQPIWRIPYAFQSESSPRERGIALSDDTSNSRLEVVCAESLRLVNGNSLCMGRVEVKSNGSWLPVCHGDFDLKDAQVFCRELGCGSPPFLQAAIYGEGKAPARSREFQCEGSESALLDCRTSDSTRNTSCSPDNTVGLDCNEPDDVRLVGGTGDCNGRLEMKHQGEWRPVVEELDRQSLSVLCRTMFCGNVESSGRREAAAGRQLVWKVAPTCRGREFSLRECGAAESDESYFTLEVKCSRDQRETP